MKEGIPSPNISDEEQHSRKFTRRTTIGASMLGAGIAGNLLLDIFPQPTDEKLFATYFVGRAVSFLLELGGVGLTLDTLIQKIELLERKIGSHRHGLQNHTHPDYAASKHTHSLPAHTHSVTTHTHKLEDIVPPPPPQPPTPQEQRAAAIGYYRENLYAQYGADMTTLGLSPQVNNILRDNITYSPHPLSVAGLRVFLKYGFPIKARNFGDKRMAELREKVAPITHPQTPEELTLLTPSEREQLIKNGIAENV